MNRFSLNGTDWICKAYLGEDWLWRNAHKKETNDRNHWHPASVPGSVLHDALQNQLVPDPRVGMNSLQAEWVPERTWVYKKSFHLPASFTGLQARLCFTGVDYHARFYLNGELLGEHTGMFTPAFFDVTPLLRPDQDNLLAVIISPAPAEQPQVGYSSKVRTHKSRMTYWWDFCPRMVHQGIWQDMFIHFFSKVCINDLYVSSQLNLDYTAATLRCAMLCNAEGSTPARIKLTVVQGQNTVFESLRELNLDRGKNQIEWRFDLNQPLLWQPNGSGEQPLYQARVEILTEENQPCDSIEKTFGIRDIRFLPNENADPQALPYTVSVNGRKTYIKGWNWVPIDAMYGVPQPEKLKHLLHLAAAAHVNLLRVWGGGLIETENFYDLCDQLGIMVWQEFIQSSSGNENIPPDDPEFVHFMEEEARQIIPLKRNHPSLAVWCGGNELNGLDSVPCDDSAPLLAVLAKCVKELDPGRAWFPTSPSGKHGSFDLRREPDIASRDNHDVHGPWEYQGMQEQYTLYNGRGDSLLHSEFGVEGITNLRTLNETLPHDHQLPISLTNPYWEHRGAWWLKEKEWKILFGEWTSVEMAVQATQFIQAEGLRYAVEADGRRQYHNSGTMPWQFNEPFPMSACTSAVDYFGYPKPAYDAVKLAYEPLHLSAKYPRLNYSSSEPFKVRIYCSNSGESVEGTVTIALRDRTGQSFSIQTAHCVILANCSQWVLDYETGLQAIESGPFFLDMNLIDDSERLVASGRILFCLGTNLAPFFAQPNAIMHVEHNQNQIEITNVSKIAALGIRLESLRDLNQQAWEYFDANSFHLLPGESRIVQCNASTSTHDATHVSIKGWNTPQILVSLQG